MALTLRRAEERGAADFGWLETRHSFSFGHYFDPDHMGFGPLRVINEDRVAPGGGFDPHPHQDMEIVSYVISGGLQHRDSMGNGSVVKAGDVQRITAGSGIRHSEFNASSDEPVHFLQIWITPERRNLVPGYEQKSFSADDKRGRLQLIGSRFGRQGSVTIHQDVEVFSSVLRDGESVHHEVQQGRGAWVQVVRGAGVLNGSPIAGGDGAAITDEGRLDLAGSGAGESEFLLFDLKL